MPPNPSQWHFHHDSETNQWYVILPDATWVAPQFVGQDIQVSKFISNPTTYVNADATKQDPRGYESFIEAIYRIAGQADKADQLHGQILDQAGTTQNPNIPPFNPVVTGTGSGGSSTSKPVDPAVSSAKSFYLTLWGTSPPKGYVEQFFKSGGDVFSFQQQELSRPGAEHQPLFQSKAASFAAQLAQMFATR